MKFTKGLQLILFNVFSTVHTISESIDLLAAFAVTKTRVSDAWKGLIQNESMINVNVRHLIKGLKHSATIRALQYDSSDSSDFGLLNDTTVLIPEFTTDLSTEVIDSQIHPKIAEITTEIPWLNIDNMNALFLCLAVRNMDNAQLAEFFQYCYVRTHRSNFPNILLDFILINVFIDAPRSHTLLNNPDAISRLQMKIFMELVTVEMVQGVVKKLVEWILFEQLENGCISVVFKSKTVGMIITGCDPENIFPILSHIHNKLFMINEIRYVTFKDIEFQTRPSLLLALSHKLLGKTNILRFNSCRFPNNTFEIPDDASELTHLKGLQFERCYINSISSSVKYLKNLKFFLIQGYKFKDIPYAISKLENLEYLKVAHGSLTTFPRWLETMQKLTKINLSSNGMTRIPEEIMNMTWLTHLVMCNNTISELPSNIGNLTKLVALVLDGNCLYRSSLGPIYLPELRKLSLRSNGLTQIPDFATGFQNLLTLVICSNQLCCLPYDFGDIFPNLTMLLMANNFLRAFPAEITSLNNLKFVSFERNLITDYGFSPYLKPMLSLKKIVLSSNPLGTFPMYLCHLANLKVLLMISCGIEEIPAEICQLTSIEGIGLGNNNLNGFPMAICELTSLIEINLSNNSCITTIPYNIRNLTKMKAIWMNKCNLRDTQDKVCTDIICGLRNLEVLDLSNNKISIISDKIGELSLMRELILFDNHIKIIPESIVRLAYLEKFKISNNNLDSFSANLCTLPLLRHLDIGVNTEIKTLPYNIGDMSSLECLNITKIGLTSFPHQILNLPNLSALFISDNDIFSLPLAIEKLSGLKVLHIYSCKIKRLPLTMGRLRWLNELHMPYNPLETSPWNQILELEQLQRLMLAGTFMREVPFNIARLKKLKSLNLAENPLKGFPLPILFLPELEKLVLCKNGFPKENDGIRRAIRTCLKRLSEYVSDDGIFGHEYLMNLGFDTRTHDEIFAYLSAFTAVSSCDIASTRRRLVQKLYS